MAYSIHREETYPQSFAKRDAVLTFPICWPPRSSPMHPFLQADPAGSVHQPRSAAAFKSIFPISSHSGNARLSSSTFCSASPPST